MCLYGGKTRILKRDSVMGFHATACVIALLYFVYRSPY